MDKTITNNILNNFGKLDKSRGVGGWGPENLKMSESMTQSDQICPTTGAYFYLLRKCVLFLQNFHKLLFYLNTVGQSQTSLIKSDHRIVVHITVLITVGWVGIHCPTIGQFDIHCPTIGQLDILCPTLQPLDIHCQTMGQLDIHRQTIIQLDIHCPSIRQLVIHCLKNGLLFMHFATLRQLDKNCLIIG